MKYFVFFLFSVLLVGCGPSKYDSNGDLIIENLELNLVKLIQEGNEDGQDPSTVNQINHTLSPTARLLMKRLGFADIAERIRTGGSKLYLQMGLSNTEEQDRALKILKVCPVTRSWMNMATWNYAGPASSKSQWKAGGAVDESSCVTGTKDYPIQKTKRQWDSRKGEYVDVPVETPNDPKAIYFDLRDWYRDYPLAKNANFGLALIASESIVVHGKSSSSYSPRLIFPR